MLILSNISKPIRYIVLFLVSLSLISIILLLSLYCGNLLEEKAFGQEIGKTLLQIIAVSVIGTIASLLLDEYKRAREELQKQIELQRRLDENKDQFRKEILRKVNKIYADTKRVRRLLRARAFPTPFHDNCEENTPMFREVYDKYMESINDSQLELEIIAKEIETNEQAFSNYREIINYIGQMEQYLGQIVTEYEQNRWDFKGTPASLAIRKLTKMKDMLGPSSGSRFKKEFVRNHKQLIASISRDLLTSPKLNSCINRIPIDGGRSMSKPQDELKAYDQLCTSYRAIDDFRMKLLGFLPLTTGAGLFLLVDKFSNSQNETKNLLLAAIGIFGFLITLGLFFYEIYGIRKCAALINAGKQIEILLHLDNGQFTTRPQNVCRVINEPFAAGIIYPTVLAAWMFVFLTSAFPDANPGIPIALLVIGFVVTLLYDRHLRKIYEKRHKQWREIHIRREIYIREGSS